MTATSEKKHKPGALAQIRKHLAALDRLRQGRERVAAEAEADGRRLGFMDDEAKALTWAINTLSTQAWRRIEDELPEPGQRILTASEVAGLGVAIFTAGKFICGCGCAEPVPQVYAWTTGFPALPGPRRG